MECFALFSPDNRQQRVFTALGPAMDILNRSPEGWILEWFDHGVSRGLIPRHSRVCAWCHVFVRTVDADAHRCLPWLKSRAISDRFEAQVW